MIKKTYIPGKPRNPKLGTPTGTSGVSKTEFNNVAGSSHEHYNKGALDLISQSNIDVLNLLSVVDGNIKVDTTLWTTGGLSALGLGSEGGGGGGGDFDRLDAWSDYTEPKAGWVLSALLGYDLHTRVNDLESSGGGSNIEVAITGSGNAVTGVSKSGNTLTFDKGINFALSTHNHAIANITGLQDALNGKEPSFAKNTAFNKNFGTTAGTVAQGNDSRILNGQTAFGWGNHSSAGYALNTALTAHTGNSTIHITATERTNWNDANSKKHTHSNKALLDLITQSNIDVLAKLSIVDGNIKVDTTLWATGGISALGLGSGGGSGGGGVDMLDSWANYTAVKANYYVPASLLVPFRNDTLSRLTSLESGSATSIVTTGSGNAITSLTKSGSVITANKGLTFALSTHTHTIAQITGLQGALDLKATQSDISTAINGIEIGGRNLFIESQNILEGALVAAIYPTITANPNATSITAKVEKNSTYTISRKGLSNRFAVGFTKEQTFPKIGDETYGFLSTTDDQTKITFTTDDEAEWVVIYSNTGQGVQTTLDDKYKIEKGNKPTDWTLAPEDQVGGGRNLILNSLNRISFISNTPATYPIQDQAVSGENYRRFRRTYPGGVTSTNITTYTSEFFTPEKSGYYTYSIYFKPNEFDIELRLRFGDTYGNYILCKANEWTQISVTAYIEAGVATRLWGVYGVMPPEAVQWIDYNRVSVTSGNITIDWTPAPEDQVSDWSTTDETSFSYIKNKPTQLSQFIDNIGVVSHIANKANPHNVTTAQIGSVDLTTNQSIGGKKTFNTGIKVSQTAYEDFIVFDRGVSLWSFGMPGNNLVISNGDITDQSNRLITIGSNGNIRVGDYIADPLYKLDVSGTGRFTGNVTASVGINTPKVDFGNGFTIEPSGTELVFKYNGVIKQRMLTDGTILATGGVTALATN